jgi:hypothetical protein
VATFGNLSLNKAGTGYALKASSGALSGATSVGFNVTAVVVSSHIIEDFENPTGYFATGNGNVSAYQASWAAHDGNYGLEMYDGNDWIYRNDAGSHVKAGDTLSAWMQLHSSADGRAYFGFGASASGTLSLVAAPNTGQLIIQSNVGYGFTDLAAVNASYQANHWYRMEVDWGASGTIVGKLFDSNGTTLLRQVTASTTAIMSGGIAFRARGTDKYFDTVTDTPGVNTFAKPRAILASAGTSTTGVGLSGNELNAALALALEAVGQTGHDGTATFSPGNAAASAQAGSSTPGAQAMAHDFIYASAHESADWMLFPTAAGYVWDASFWMPDEV